MFSLAANPIVVINLLVKCYKLLICLQLNLPSLGVQISCGPVKQLAW